MSERMDEGVALRQGGIDLVVPEVATPRLTATEALAASDPLRQVTDQVPAPVSSGTRGGAAHSPARRSPTCGERRSRPSRADGRTRWFVEVRRPFQGTPSAPREVLAIATDVRERRRTWMGPSC